MACAHHGFGGGAAREQGCTGPHATFACRFVDRVTAKQHGRGGRGRRDRIGAVEDHRTRVPERRECARLGPHRQRDPARHHHLERDPCGTRRVRERTREAVHVLVLGERADAHRVTLRALRAHAREVERDELIEALHGALEPAPIGITPAPAQPRPGAIVAREQRRERPRDRACPRRDGEPIGDRQRVEPDAVELEYRSGALAGETALDRQQHVEPGDPRVGHAIQLHAHDAWARQQQRLARHGGGTFERACRQRQHAQCACGSRTRDRARQHATRSRKAPPVQRARWSRSRPREVRPGGARETLHEAQVRKPVGAARLALRRDQHQFAGDARGPGGFERERRHRAVGVVKEDVIGTPFEGRPGIGPGVSPM